MKGRRRRVVMELEFEAALGETCRAIREEGLQVNARIDVRDHFWRDLGQDFRRYVVLDTWSPELALEALQHDLDAGAVFHTMFAIYELGKATTAVVVMEPSSIVAVRGRHRDALPLVLITERQSDRVTRVLERLPHASRHQTAVLAAT